MIWSIMTFLMEATSSDGVEKVANEHEWLIPVVVIIISVGGSIIAARINKGGVRETEFIDRLHRELESVRETVREQDIQIREIRSEALKWKAYSNQLYHHIASGEPPPPPKPYDIDL